MAVYSTWQEGGRWYWAVHSSNTSTQSFRGRGGPCSSEQEAIAAAGGFAQGRGEEITGEVAHEELLEL